MKPLIAILALSALCCSAIPPKNVVFGKAPFYPPQAGLVQWLNGGNSTQAVARVGTNATYGGVNCLFLNGTDAAVEIAGATDFVYANDYSGSMHFKTGAFGQYDTVFASVSASAGRFGIAYDVSAGFICVNAYNGSSTGVWASVSANTEYTLTWDWNGATMSGTLNGAAMDGTTTKSVLYAATASTIVGARTARDRYAELHLYDVEVDGQFRLSCEEGAGTLIYDVSGNGNDGTAANCVWTNADGIASYNLLYGFRADSTTNIPALLDGSAAADTNPITNPGGYVHNGCEALLILADVTTNSYADLRAFTNNFGTTHASYDTDSGRILNVLQYSSAQTNTILDLYLEVMK